MFTDEQKAVLADLGFEFSFDLVGEVAFKAQKHWPDRYVVICPDGEVMHIQTSDIVAALGTY